MLDSSPMLEVHSSPAADFYPARHADLSAEGATAAKRVRRLALLLTVLAAVAILLLVAALRALLPSRLILVPVIALIVAGVFYLRSHRVLDRIERLLRFYDVARARLDGTQTQTGLTGDEFRAEGHLYDLDLAILGASSLFGLLATVRTGVGQRGLARDLLRPHTRAATLARQAAVQELAPNNPLREQIHLLGASKFQQVPAAFFDDWLAQQPPVFHPAWRYILFTLSGLLVLLGVSGLWTFFPFVVAVQAGVGWFLRPRVLAVLGSSGNMANQIKMFRDGLALLESTSFAAPHLTTLQQDARQPMAARQALKKLESQCVIVDQRTKEWFFVASLLTNAGTHAALSIAGWKRRHAAAMQGWLAAWAEFESLNALATYAFEHPGNTYPEMVPEDGGLFEATALAHPLLGAEAVANDIALNDVTGLYLISGSNMAGKSTLLRAVGLNAVLAAAGAPVRATGARISPLVLGASLALTDSLAEGRSKFLAEVERLHDMLQLAAGPTPVLFLIDEIFSGTNSVDRRVAAEAVARALIRAGAIGALSTHDLTLTGMAEDPALRAINVHMASPDPADPLAFDYRLKPGVNPSTNALAILRLIGIEL